MENTQIFARLHTKVMFELSSKYSLALYEFLQKRKNLQFIKTEKLSVEETRALLGVEKNKLKSFGHFNDKELKPALKEVVLYDLGWSFLAISGKVLNQFSSKLGFYWLYYLQIPFKNRSSCTF